MSSTTQYEKENPLKRIVMILMFVGLAFAPVHAAEDSGMELMLDDAITFIKDGAVNQRCRAEITALRRDGKWHEIQVFGYNRGTHRGRVKSFEQTADAITVAVELLVGRDAWRHGGVGVYTAQLKRAGEGWAGNWKGVWAYGLNGPAPCEGKATLRFLPPAKTPAAAANWVGQSPLLLFRKSDLPRLRERMNTPFGQALAARMAGGNAICRGALYQLTGDKAHAQAARELTEKTMAERGGGSFAVGRVWGYRAFDVAVAYDLCRDAWDAPFRKQVEWYLDWISQKSLLLPWTLSNKVNLTPGSNYMVVIYPGAAAATLARVSDRTPEPLPPDERFVKFIAVRPPEGYRPPEGFPVEEMKSGVPPRHWVSAGHWPETGLTPEEAARALPRDGAGWSKWGIGSQFKPSDTAFTLRPLREDEYYPNKELRQINMTEVCMSTERSKDKDKDKERSYFQRAALTTAVTISEKMTLRSKIPGTLFMGGERIKEDDCFIAEPGAYPLVFIDTTGELLGQPWGHVVRTPFFQRVTEAELNILLASRAIEHEVLRHFWEDDRRDWKESGGSDRSRFRLVQRGAQLNRLNLQGGMGDGGFQGEGEGYTLECFRPLLDYAWIYRNVFGEDLSQRPDASHFAARYAFAAIWGEPGKTPDPAIAQSYGGSKGVLPVDYLGSCYALTPAEWKPALHWFWLKQLGVSADEVRTAAGAAKAFQQWPADLSLVMAFLNYPLDAQPRNPSETMPKVWAADGKGYYAFRNTWSGADDIVAQFYAKDGVNVGWHSPEAGCFQIAGFGHEWAAKGAHDRGGERWLENVVLMPEDNLNESARCKVLSRELDATQARGSIAVDMDELYKVLKPKLKPKWGEGPDIVDGGIRGRRAFAADLSGRAGAPAVIAVADTVRGGGKKVWQMFVPNLTVQAMTTQGNRFTITKGTATLCGTVVSPVGATITAVIPPDGTNPDPKVPDAAFRGIRIQGADPTTGEFWVVLTLQNGDAPVLKTQGVGLATQVRISNTTLRFADGKLIWE